MLEDNILPYEWLGGGIGGKIYHIKNPPQKNKVDIIRALCYYLT